MINIAHASSLEAAKTRDKKRRAQKSKAKAEWAALGKDKQDEILEKRFAVDWKQRASAVIYDIEHNHIVPVHAKKTLKTRLAEIAEEIKKNPAVEQYRDDERNKIRGVLNGLH